MVAKKKTAKTTKTGEKKTEAYLFARKAALLGIGVAAITKEKADSLVKDLIKKGDLNKDEGKKLVAEVLKKSKKSKDELETTVNKQVHLVIKKANVASRKEINILEKKIKKLEGDIKKLTDKK
ncbi:MAG: hypothetical protein KAJ20_01035 [Candidatus Aenigmarchaeota archaeon]|nr:hypothetical protein [Candidatus Aenigmarchaeota archaeon]MCK5372901.1 hypothetical protein [Candidatus Aenigmarchaeota archaeon]